MKELKLYLNAILLVSFIIFLPTYTKAAVKWVRVGNTTGNFQTSATIVWHTDAACTGVVKYGFDINYQNQIEVQPQQSADFGFVYRANLTNLTPGKLYHYRVGCDSQGWSDDGVFKTESSNPCSSFNFVAGGDSRGDIDLLGFYMPSTVWPGVFTEATNLNPAFVINTGDLVREGKEASQWAKFLDSTTPIWRVMPLFWVIGNHDDDSIEGADAKVNQVAVAPKNPITNSQDFYSFDYGLAHFVILSTETFNKENISTQTQWLENDLSNTDRPWKFAFFHRPFYTSGSHSPNEENRAGPFIPIIESHGVDIVFCGHNHVYERFSPIKDGIIKPLGEGTIYITAGGGGALLDYLYPTRSKDPRLENWKLEFGFVEIKISVSNQENTTTLTAIYHRTASGNTGGGASATEEFSYSKQLPNSICSQASTDGDEDMDSTDSDSMDTTQDEETQYENEPEQLETSEELEIDANSSDSETIEKQEIDNEQYEQQDIIADSTTEIEHTDTIQKSQSNVSDSGCASSDTYYWFVIILLMIAIFRNKKEVY